MELVSANHAANAALVPVYAGDDLVDRVTREKSREMRDAGTHYFSDHGKKLRKIVRFAQSKRSAVRKALGWQPRNARWRAAAMEEGRASCIGRGMNAVQTGGVGNYPVPPVFKGHVTMPNARAINSVPKQEASNGTL